MVSKNVILPYKPNTIVIDNSYSQQILHRFNMKTTMQEKLNLGTSKKHSYNVNQALTSNSHMTLETECFSSNTDNTQ